ncbi:MAG: serpin family protein [Butyrivibrio sp.]
MIKKFISVLLSCSMALGMTGCTLSAFSEKYQSEEITIKRESERAFGACSEDFIKNSSDFSVELFKKCFSEGNNTLVSPVSVMLALGMTGNGAAGNTEAQFENLLGADIDELNRNYKAYVGGLKDTDEAHINIANSLWIKKDFPVKNDFLERNADYYNAAVFKSQFDKTTVSDINKWVKNNTDGMIGKILDGDIESDTFMFIINAVAFEAEWETVYETHQIRDTEFTTTDGSRQTVDGMFGSETVYLEDEKASGFIKKYKNGYSFAALLPNENISVEEYIQEFTGDKYLELLNNSQECTVYTMIPKFSYDYGTSLKETLSEMGLSDAFTPEKADFSLMTDETPAYIGDVVHKTFIQVDDKGTKAGAATIVEMKCGSAMIEEEIKTVYLDRPFVYVIMDDLTNIPIFMGVVTEIE